MSVREIARQTVTTVSLDTYVDEIVDTMVDKGVGSVVVTDGDRPVGIVTDRDVVTRAYAADADLGSLSTREIMSDDLITVAGGVGIYELLQVMAEHGVRRMPVVGEEGAEDAGDLVGIVTLDDVLLLLGMEMQRIAQLIRAESPPFETPVSRLYDR